MKPGIALRIEVPAYRAARALPALTECLRRHGCDASFAFAFGPDWLGRSLARQGAAALRQVREAGFEVGVHGWQAGEWLKRAAGADAAWSESQLARALAAFERVFAAPPQFFAAPGWRSNPHALRLTQRLKFSWASDTRGRHPFLPVWNGEIVRCPQIPTTLPTLDELAATSRAAPAATVDAVLALTAVLPPAGHVFSLPAGARPPLIDRLLAGWREQGHEVISVRTLAAALAVDKLPRHEVVAGTVPGRRGAVLMQGDEFLSAWQDPS